MNRVPEILGLLILACTVSACGGGDNGTNQNPVVYDYQLPSDRSDGWAIGSLADVAIDQARIEQVTRQIIGGTYTGIDSFVIVRNGQLVHDVYFGDFNAARRHDLRSATKSITSMLVGIAIDQGYIGNADEPALAYITAYSNLRNWDKRKNDIAVKHFLTMTPGLACDDQDRSSPGNEAEMYPRNDWVRFVLDLPMLDDPGSNWAYCTAGVVALGAVLLEATGMPADDFSDVNLFEPLGIND